MDFTKTDINQITLYILYFFIGAFSGVSLGLIGLGAGLFTIPFLIYSGLTLQQSVAISLIVQLLPQSLPGVYSFYKAGFINRHIIAVALLVLFGSLLGIQFGVYLNVNNIIKRKTIYNILSATLILSGIYVFRKNMLMGEDEELLEVN
mgnify:FL=1|tara:strand:- start:4354 stop:4797 length:444 start_codon:yes stop_codon:yes gene_type:complete